MAASIVCAMRFNRAIANPIGKPSRQRHDERVRQRFNRAIANPIGKPYVATLVWDATGKRVSIAPSRIGKPADNRLLQREGS